MSDPTDIPEGEILSGKALGALAIDVCEGNQDALRFCISLSDVALTMDHVIDGDTVNKERAERAFLTLMLDWPTNRFIREFAVPLTCAMAGAVSAWKSSDVLPGARLKAYDCISEVWSTVAFILGGWERVNRVMPAVRFALAEQQAVNDFNK